MFRFLFIVLALWATLPAALCQAACDGIGSLASVTASTASDMEDSGSHCGMMRGGEMSGGTAHADGLRAPSPGSPASPLVPGPSDASSCDGCDSEPGLILVSNAEADFDSPTWLIWSLDALAEGRAGLRRTLRPRAPPDRSNSPYLYTRRPLLI